MRIVKPPSRVIEMNLHYPRRQSLASPWSRNSDLAVAGMIYLSSGGIFTPKCTSDRSACLALSTSSGFDLPANGCKKAAREGNQAQIEDIVL
jgi:hypothetical protein